MVKECVEHLESGHRRQRTTSAFRMYSSFREHLSIEMGKFVDDSEVLEYSRSIGSTGEAVFNVADRGSARSCDHIRQVSWTMMFGRHGLRGRQRWSDSGTI